MKTKTIKATLRKKHNELLESIDDEAVRDLVAKNSIITGGSIASMLLRETVNDYDIYFTNKETVFAVAQYYVAQFRKMNDRRLHVMDDEGQIKILMGGEGVAAADDDPFFDAEDEEPITHDDKEYEKYSPVFMSENAITLSHQVQLILRFYGDAEEIHKNYDFIHCTNYWESKSGDLTLHKAALEALLTKELRYVGSKYPLCSLIRVRKFIRRDWTITAGQILKICVNLQEFDLCNVDVLKDQLTGVDVAYFNEVIAVLKEKDTKEVDSTYLMTIIDRIF